MLVRGGEGKHGEWGCPPWEKPLPSPIRSPIPTTPRASACPPPSGRPYLDGPEAEAVEQGSRQQAAGEAENRSEWTGGGYEVRNGS